MGLEFGFNPVPKPQSRPKDKPKPKEKRPKKRKKKLETYKGRTIPPARARGSISKKEYQRAIEAFGSVCCLCGDPRIEMHHIKFRSQQGRGNYRNLIPLCREHHNQAHQQRAFADRLREERESLFGKFYACDKYDLFKLGLIPTPTDEMLERFMKESEKRENM